MLRPPQVKKSLTNVVEAVISLMHITEAQKDTWESDPNQFVEDGTLWWTQLTACGCTAPLCLFLGASFPR